MAHGCVCGELAGGGDGGSVFTHQNAYINSDAFTLSLTLTMLIATVIGGLGTSYGPLIGTFSITLMIAELIASLYDVSFLINGLILLGVLLLFPQGAIGLVERVSEQLRGKARGPAEIAGPLPAVSLGAPTAPAGKGPALVVESLTKRYDGVVAVREVSLSVERGTVHALIGPNGAGKSTLINCVSGLYQSDFGQFS